MSTNDIETLKQIAHESPTAERVFTFFALRLRHRNPMDLTKMKRALRKSGEAIDEDAYNNIFAELAKRGYGKVLKNHTGKPTHFVMNHPVYQLGKAAIEGKAIKAVVAAPRKPAPKPAPVSLAVDNTTQRTVIYCISNGKKMKVELQGDVAQDMVDRVIASLQPRTAVAN